MKIWKNKHYFNRTHSKRKSRHHVGPQNSLSSRPHQFDGGHFYEDTSIFLACIHYISGEVWETTRSIVVIWVNICKLKQTIYKYNLSGQLTLLYVVKYKVRKMSKSLLKHHCSCYCPILLMRTTKTAVCLQTKAIFYHLYGLKLKVQLNFMHNTFFFFFFFFFIWSISSYTTRSSDKYQ